MQEVVISFIEGYGYLSLCFLMILENIFPPIPSEIILTFAGFMTHTTHLTHIGVIVVGTLGAYLGSLILFLIGRGLSLERLNIWLDKPLIRFLHFQKKDIEKTRNWFFKHGKKAVFIGRLVPVIRSFISIPAGMAKMPFFTYSIYTILGTVLWNSCLVFIGSFLQGRWAMVSVYMKHYQLIWLLVLAFFCLYLYIKKKRT